MEVMNGLDQVRDPVKFKSLVVDKEISTDEFAFIADSKEKLSDIIKEGVVSRRTQELYFSMRLSHTDGYTFIESIEKGNFQIEMEVLDNSGEFYKVILMPVTLNICTETEPEENMVFFPSIEMMLQRQSLQSPQKMF